MNYRICKEVAPCCHLRVRCISSLIPCLISISVAQITTVAVFSLRYTQMQTQQQSIALSCYAYHVILWGWR